MNPDAVLNAILRRRSCRKFVPGVVSAGDMNKILTAGVYAPCGFNTQHVRFLVLDDQEEIKAFATDKTPKHWLGDASAIIAVFCDPSLHPCRDAERYIWSGIWPHNAAAAIENTLLMVSEIGLGACWISSVDAMAGTRLLSGKQWRELFPHHDIPPQYQIHGLVAIGHPAVKDAEGYAMGDEKHGGHPVSRRPVADYMIERRP